jgi:hypothetical protein
MAGQAEKNTATPSPTRFPKMLTLVQVQEILNIGMPALRAMVTSGELRAVQLGGRGYLAHLVRLMRILPGIAGEELECRAKVLYGL